MERVNYYEGLLDITGARWGPEHLAYQKAKTSFIHRAYNLALDAVEKLVVQRLFELQKTHLASTGTFLCLVCGYPLTISLLGYKLRMQIASYLSKRSEAITTAVTKLNAAAAKLTPPRPPILITDILSYSFLAEFDLLRNSRQDVRRKPWSHPSVRIIIEKYYRLVRAKEEIVRLNVEMRRLRTWMRDDEGEMKRVLGQLRMDGSPLGHELGKRLRMKQLTNIKIGRYLDKVESMNGFTGERVMGVGQYTSELPTPTLPSVNANAQAVTPAASVGHALDHEEAMMPKTTSIQMRQRWKWMRSTLRPKEWGCRVSRM